MTTKKEKDADVDRRIGIALGAGLSVEKAADLIGVAPNTIRAHLDKNRAFILTVKAETESAVQTRITAVELKADEKQTLDSLKTEIREKVYAELLKRLKSEGLDDALFVKFSRLGLEFTDEKPAQVQKRISEHTEKVEHSISGETLDRLERLASKMEGRPLHYPALPGVIDVIDV